ncbi:NYN domain-containing protein [Jannaschia pohangensis]|uniref:NYN domain-containing protein n=1 Tax=Jannaschia pohangensis TaxID=390807 RepID=A0A1I3HP87_9RHOB|nr:NYN domain-containing protein [Jannaschia pohangensis]SFI37566.1 NYN domain-containing protein [Jannaschia pohangensis]
MKHDSDMSFAPPALTTAVFIDADNISARHAATIFAEGGRSPRMMRAYGDAIRAKEWRAHHAVEFRDTGTGKNASDLALAVDAIDAAHSCGLTRVIICSSDGDFRHLALALRAMGVHVIGIGEAAKRPKPFATVCSRWIGLPDLSEYGVGPVSLSDQRLCEVLRDFIKVNSKGGRGVAISQINRHVMSDISKQDQTVPSRWRRCLSDTDKFAVDRTDADGTRLPDPMVRFLPDGFRASA